jgi:CHAD domain-containing protein
MKARKVKGLDPQMALVDAAERIVRVRLAEFCELAAGAREPQQLHDTRIAAKRLRYVLEIMAPLFDADAARRRCKEVQELLGDLHDCDVMLPRVEALGLESLAAELAERRRQLLEGWLQKRAQLERDGFRARLEAAVAER